MFTVDREIYKDMQANQMQSFSIIVLFERIKLCWLISYKQAIHIINELSCFNAQY